LLPETTTHAGDFVLHSSARETHHHVDGADIQYLHDGNPRRKKHSDVNITAFKCYVNSEKTSDYVNTSCDKLELRATTFTESS
jgi:hypothetical protein